MGASRDETQPGDSAVLSSWASSPHQAPPVAGASLGTADQGRNPPRSQKAEVPLSLAVGSTEQMCRGTSAKRWSKHRAVEQCRSGISAAMCPFWACWWPCLGERGQLGTPWDMSEAAGDGSSTRGEGWKLKLLFARALQALASPQRHLQNGHPAVLCGLGWKKPLWCFPAQEPALCVELPE